VLVEVEVVVGVAEFVGVGEIVGEALGGGVSVAKLDAGGRPTTRAVRNRSTMPSRRACRCNCGQTLLISGTITGWLKSTLTITRSPGPPASLVSTE
jgi:hypothetical protein